MASAGSSADVFALKQVRYIERDAAIVLQNVNGPCPLVALANVLSLRNLIQIPRGRKVIGVEELQAMVANKMLDIAAGGDANREQNVADAVALLPKMATGLDVNVRFRNATDFEFTDEIAIFDLLDVPLVHGWVVDRDADPDAAAAVGDASYNEAVTLAISCVSPVANDETHPRPFGDTPQDQADAGVVPPPAAADEEEDEDELKQALALSLSETTKREEPPLIDLDAAPGNGDAAGDTQAPKDPFAELAALSLDDNRGDNNADANSASSTADVRAEELPALSPQEPPPSTEGIAEASPPLATTTPTPLSPPLTDDTEQLSPMSLPTPAIDTPEPRRESINQTARGFEIRRFLDETATQLTQAGLRHLRDALRERQLGVFFRNNHFGTILKREGELFILVTDLGYEKETRLVWERLDSIRGTGGYYTADFVAFGAGDTAETAAQASTAAALLSAAAGGQSGEVPASPPPTASKIARAQQEDADLALALQLEEQEREEERRRREQAAAAQRQEQALQAQAQAHARLQAQQRRQPQRQQPQAEQRQQPPQRRAGMSSSSSCSVQ